MAEPLGFFAASAGAKLFQYNRKGYQFDQQQRMKRNFKTFNSRVNRYGMFREDIRDLVDLTVGKMDFSSQETTTESAYLFIGAFVLFFLSRKLLRGYIDN